MGTTETTTTNGCLNLEALTKPFEKEVIQQRKGRFGQMLDYVGAHYVIERLNSAIKGEWSFCIKEHVILEDEVIVLGELSSHGISHQQFGSSSITRSKQSNEPVSIGDDLKGAASDCLKKCATQFGVGLHLYGLEIKPNGNGGKESANPRPEEEEEPEEQSHRVTNAQMSKIFQVAKQKGIPQNQLIKKIRNRFSKALYALTTHEADELLTILEDVPS